MTHDHIEQLVRDAFSEEAARHVDPSEVLATVRGGRPRRRTGLVLATAAVAVVVAAVATFVVPQILRKSTVPPADEQRQTQRTVTPTTVLLVGTDTRANTDSMVLVRTDADGSASAASLPRDLWVSVGGTMTRLNQVAAQAGVRTLLTAVGEVTGVPVDHYVKVDMAVVADLTNAVGGVAVCLRSAVDDQYSDAHFPSGEQVLHGSAALSFLRQRHGLPHGDLDRIARLQAVLRSLVAELPDADLRAVVEAVEGRVETDPGLDLLGFATDLAAATSLHIGTIPTTGEITTEGGGAALGVDPAQVRRFVADQPSTPPADDTVPCVN